MPLPLDVGLRAGVVYLVLVLAIPIQYYLSNQMAVPAGQRDATFKRLLMSLKNIWFKYGSVSSWEQWCWNVWQKVDSWRTGKKVILSDDYDGRGESPAFEVMMYKNPHGYFGASMTVRSVRPPEVKYRVGQVIQHKTWGYRGVIVGWDPRAHAPVDWLEKMHPPDKGHWRKMPNYAVLVDTRDRALPQMTYVPQENIEIISQTEVIHPELDSYFDSFDGAQYIMRPALQYLYPRD